jgi:hypothetical protein
VAREQKRPGEFQRYRRALLAVYLLAAAGFALLLVASIVKDLFFRGAGVARAAASTDRAKVADPLECHERVTDLLTGLGVAAGKLVAGPATDQDDDRALPSMWEEFSRTWRDEWDVAAARCRFADPTAGAATPAFQRLATVHGGLPAMRLRYTSLLARFNEEQAAELARMRRALDLARRDLADQADAAPAR